MSTTIDINVPLCRYGNIVINKAHITWADTRSGVVLMDDGSRYEFPPDVVGAWFSDVADYATLGKKPFIGRAK